MPAPTKDSFVRVANRYLIPMAASTQSLAPGAIFDFVVPLAGPLDSGIAVARSTLVRWSLRQSVVSVVSGARDLISLQSARIELLIGATVIDRSPLITSGITALAHGQALSSTPRDVQFDDFALLDAGAATGNWLLQLVLEMNNTDTGAHNATVGPSLWEIDYFELTQTTYPFLDE
jgi:hypothetical protein